MKIDTSIFEQAKEELLNALSAYEKIEKLDTVLFIVDEEMHHLILQTQKLLEMEYGYDESIAKKYSIDTIVKYISPLEPVHSYSLYEKTFHKQISDPKKVFAQLETEFGIWRRRHKKNVLKELKALKVSNEVLKEKAKELDAEIELKREKHQYILDNFENLDVKISALEHRPSFGIVIRYKVPSSKKEKGQRLKNSVANIIYFKEFETFQENNKIVHFLKNATNAYGDVYYIEKKNTTD